MTNPAEPTPKTINFEKQNAELADFVARVKARQSEYIKSAGRYIQFLPTLADVPDKDTGDFSAAKAESPDEKYLAIANEDKLTGADIAPLTFVATIDVYEAPYQQHGCTVTATCKVGDATYRKTVDIAGMESRQKEWSVINE